MRLLSSATWVEGWLGKVLGAYPPPDKYLPVDGSPAPAAGIYARMEVIGEHRNKLNRAALHYLLRACHQPEDLEVGL